MVPWVSFIGLSRRWIDRMKTKTTRVGFDLAVVTVLRAAGLVRRALDAARRDGLRRARRRRSGNSGTRVRAALMLAGMILLAALPGLLFAFLIWPAALLSVLSLFVPESPARAAGASEDAP